MILQAYNKQMRQLPHQTVFVHSYMPLHVYASPSIHSTVRPLCPDMCQDPKKIRDPGSAESKIHGLCGSWILSCSFCRRILGIQDLNIFIYCGILKILDLNILICREILKILYLNTVIFVGSWRSCISTLPLVVGSWRSRISTFWIVFGSYRSWI